MPASEIAKAVVPVTASGAVILNVALKLNTDPPVFTVPSRINCPVRFQPVIPFIIKNAFEGSPLHWHFVSES